MRRISIIILLIFWVTSCNVPIVDSRKASPNNPTGMPATEASYMDCGWNWDTRPLPELSTEIQAAFENAGMSDITAFAEAFGETCTLASGVVDHFATLETDFHVSIETPDLANIAAMGNQLELILNVLDSVDPQHIPGPQPGYIGVRFTNGTEEIYLWFKVTQAGSARELGLHGADLFSKLKDQ